MSALKKHVGDNKSFIYPKNRKLYMDNYLLYERRSISKSASGKLHILSTIKTNK